MRLQSGSEGHRFVLRRVVMERCVCECACECDLKVAARDTDLYCGQGIKDKGKRTKGQATKDKALEGTEDEEQRTMDKRHMTRLGQQWGAQCS